jgi:hypothetical protein
MNLSSFFPEQASSWVTTHAGLNARRKWPPYGRFRLAMPFAIIAIAGNG